MALKQFGKAVDEAAIGEDFDREVLDEVAICGREVTIYVPTAGQAAYLALAVSMYNQGDTGVAIGNIVNFIGNLLDEDGGKWWRKVLVDPRYEVDHTVILGLATSILEEVSGDPTPAPSTSAAQRPSSGGRTSTAGSRRAGSTRSGSRSAGS